MLVLYYLVTPAVAGADMSQGPLPHPQLVFALQSTFLNVIIVIKVRSAYVETNYQMLIAT